MKLKYYMRGLGIGIVLTTLILTISNPKEKLTDTEIIKRAKELGMVEKQEVEDKALGELLEKNKVTTEPSAAPTKAPEATPEPTSEPTLTPTPSPEPTQEPTPTPTVEIPDNTDRDGVNTGELITFTIERGMSSNKVAKLLEEEGLIEDSKDFNKYVVKEGKAGIIRVGSYTLPKGTSYDDIIKIITSKE